MIFLVDDDESLLRAVSRLLRRRGHVVCTFTSAVLALEAIPSKIPGCLILDIQMPGMTGLELQSRLVEGGHDVPVIFLTAHAEPQYEKVARKQGAVAVLEKPCDREVLLSTVDTHYRHLN